MQPTTAADPALQQFLLRLDGPHWTRLVLAKPCRPAVAAMAAVAVTAPEAGAQRVVVRPLLLRGQRCLNFVYSHQTQDITKNLPWAQGVQRVQQLLGPGFRNAHLFTAEEEIQLSLSTKGQGHLSTVAASATPSALPPSDGHDRDKQRWLSLQRPFLAELGVTTAEHQLVPAMARKWKQINKFLEVLDRALHRADLLPWLPQEPSAPLRVVDFGAGKAYLTFAVHDWLQQRCGVAVQVTGVELRPELVQSGNHIVAALGLQGLQLVQGDLRSHVPAAMDVMIALHACDTATDDAIHLGLRAGARVIVCSPCCHKELRPQLLSPHPLRSVLQHGIHAEQTAEMITDSLRALLLQAQGYETQVFEFVTLEHTRKNKMILAVKRAPPGAPARQAALDQVDALKQFFGVREQRLLALLEGSWVNPAGGGSTFGTSH